MAPAKIEFLKMAMPSNIGRVRLRLPLTDKTIPLRWGAECAPEVSIFYTQVRCIERTHVEATTNLPSSHRESDRLMPSHGTEYG